MVDAAPSSDLSLLTWSELLILSIATNRGLLARRETEGVRQPVER